MVDNRELQVVAENQDLQNTLIIAVEGQDRHIPYADLALTFSSSTDDILEVVRPMIQEGFGVDIKDGYSGWLYKVQKATNNQNIYIIPNSTAGN